MSLLSENEAPPRAEARTAAGWQRFDRAALMGGLGLGAVWLVLWLLGAVFDGPEPAGEPPLARAPAAASPGTDRTDPAPAGTDTGGSRTGAAGEDRSPTAAPGGDAASGIPSRENGTEAGSASAPAPTGETATTAPAGTERMADAGPAATPRPLAVPRPGQTTGGTASTGNGVENAGARGPTPAAADTAGAPAGGPGGSDEESPAAAVSGTPLLPGANDGQPATAGNPLLERIPLRSSGPISAAGTKTEPERGADVQLALLDPILDLRSSDGRLQIDGILGSDESRTALVRAALKVYGMRNLTDRLAVSAGVAPFTWSENMADLMVLLDGPESDLRVRVSGEMVTLSGEVGSLDDKLAKGLQAQQLFGTTAIIDNRLQVPSASVAGGEATDASDPVAAAGDGGGEPASSTNVADAAPASGPQQTAAGTSDGVESTSVAAGTTPGASESAAGAPDTTATTDEQAEPDVPPDAEGGRQAAAGEVRADPRGAPDNFRLRECARVVTGVYITFASASARLDPRSREILDDIVPCLPRREYVVGGHTDNRGPGASNRELSRLRAEAVRAYLVSKGADAAGLEAVGHGETKPVATNNTAAGRARNRRVDFRLKG